MATWVPAPAVGRFAAVAEGTLLPKTGGYPVYNSAPLWVPAPSATKLINQTTGYAI
jgi:hypothetical protein